MDPLTHLIGKSVVGATLDTLTLSDGSRLQFERDASDCCSWMELRTLSTTNNIITAAEYRDTEGDDEYGNYRAWLHVVTEAGEFNIAEAEGNPGNGYYLHGFALGVTVLPPEATS